MAAQKPQTMAALGSVKGVGEKKLERFGEVFLKVIGGAAPETALED
jgi:ATP-dependent DNA helicase RecQ